MHENKCIENGQEGTLGLFIFDCNPNESNPQHCKWRLLDDGRIQNLCHGKYLAVNDCDVKSEKELGGRNFETDNLCAPSQKWKFSINVEPFGK